MPSEECLVCKTDMSYETFETDIHTIDCPLCGRYLLEDSAVGSFRERDISPRQRANISGWLRENQRYKITAENIETLFNIKTPSFHEKADKFLFFLERATEHAGEYIQRDSIIYLMDSSWIKESWVTSAWCINEEELLEITKYLERCGRVLKAGGPAYKIAPEGWARLEELKELTVDSQQGFVAIWFDDTMQEVYDNVISQAILAAGYKPHRVDQREHNGKIDDEIIAQIRRSRFVLADFTGHRGGVYFEAGFAKGLGLEVFWSCKEDEIEDLHFDIRQYNCIPWKEDALPDFKKRIQFRIESVIGKGTYR